MQRRSRTQACGSWQAGKRSGPPGGGKKRQGPGNRGAGNRGTCGDGRAPGRAAGGWIGALSGDGEAAVPDARSPPGDAAFAWLLPGYAFAQVLQLVLNLTPTDSVGDGTDAPELNRAVGIATFTIGSSTYAAVAASDDNGVQILDVTDPADIDPTDSVGDTDALSLKSPWDVGTFELDGRTYAAVTSRGDSGVQILDVTDPASVVTRGNITDADHGSNELSGARGIAVFESGGLPYAAVAGYLDGGVQILNLTDPDAPARAGDISHIRSSTADNVLLGRPDGVAVFNRDGTDYAAVADSRSDAVQIISLADPAAPTAAGNIRETAANATEYHLDGALGIDTFESGGLPYAAVTGYDDNGVQILNLTDPSNPTAAGSISGTGDILLTRPWGIAVFELSGTDYAAVAARNNDAVQIISLADPAAPTAAGNIRETSANATSYELNGPAGITTFTIDGTVYAGRRVLGRRRRPDPQAHRGVRGQPPVDDRLCHHLEDHNGRRVNHHPRHRHVHDQLGGRHHGNGRHRLPDARVRVCRKPHGPHLRRP